MIFKRDLITTTALTVALLTGYGRRAYSACVSTGGVNYLCSGFNTSSQVMTADNTQATTASGFQVTTNGAAIIIVGDGDVSFTDNYNSLLNSNTSTGIYITSEGDVGGSGSVALSINGNITAAVGSGIYATNYGSGDLSITADGDITVYGTGIIAYNAAGHNSFIRTGANSYISGRQGIFSTNNGTGGTFVEVAGDIQTYYDSIAAYNLATTVNDLRITVGPDSYIYSALGRGVIASNDGSGSIDINIDGDITADQSAVTASAGNGATGNINIRTGTYSIITSADGYGISVDSYSTGGISVSVDGDISSFLSAISVKSRNAAAGGVYIRTGTDSVLTSDFYGIYALNQGADNIKVISDGSVTSTSTRGILVQNTGSGSAYLQINGTVSAVDEAVMGYNTGDNLVIETGMYSDIQGVSGQIAVYGLHLGTGSLAMRIGGDVTGGVVAYGSANGTDVSVSTGAYSYISTSSDGIYARNYSATGTLSVTVDGQISAGNSGVYVRNHSRDVNIVTGADSVIEAVARSGIYVTHYGTGDVNVTANGEVSGYSGIYVRTSPDANGINIETVADSLITGTGGHGIHTINNGNDGGTSITVGGDVNGAASGVVVQDTGAGDARVTINGHVTGQNEAGLVVRNYTGGVMEIVTSTGSSVSSATAEGIYARQRGLDAMSIDIDGIVTGATRGMRILNVEGDGIEVTTRAGSSVTGVSGNGIDIDNTGTGDLDVTLGGDAAGVKGVRIKNGSYATHGTLVTEEGSTITGTGDNALEFLHYGTGNSSVTVNGALESDYAGLYMYHSVDSAAASLVTGADSVIHGGDFGIKFIGNAADDIAITIGGEVTSEGQALYILGSTGSDMSIDLTDGSVISSSSLNNAAIGIRSFGNASLSVDGDVYGYNMGAGFSGYGGNVSFDMGVTGSITSAIGMGVLLENNLNGSIVASVDGMILGATEGLQITNVMSGGSTSLATGADSRIEGGGNALVFNHYGSGALSMVHHGEISGNLGIEVNNHGDVTGLIETDGVIEGTGGTAILIRTVPFQTASVTNIEITGGRIIGDVVDIEASENLSRVSIAGNFTSEGDFIVSDFDVVNEATFTLGANNYINSYNAIDIDADSYFVIGGTGTSITGDMNVNGGTGVLDVREDFSISGNLANNGTVSIGTGKELTIGTMSAATGELIFGVNSAANHALLTVQSSAADITNQNIIIDVTGVDALVNNDQMLLIRGNGAVIGGPGGVATTVDDTSTLWNFQIIDGTGAAASTSAADIFLIAQQAASMEDLAYTKNNANAGNVLMDLQGNTTNPELLAIIANMNGASTDDELNEVLEAVQPNNDNAEAATAMSFTQRMMDMASMRLDDLRSTDALKKSDSASLGETDMPLYSHAGLKTWALSFGDGGGEKNAHGINAMNNKEWQSAFGRYSRQQKRDGIDGYRAAVGGAAVGVDTGNALPGKIFGIALSYAHSDINSFNANRSELNIDGYQAMVYASKDLGKDAFFDVMASYARNDNATTRHDVGGVSGLTAKGKYTSQETGLKGTLGKDVAYGDYVLTQMYSLDWVHYMAEDYTETGAGGANLSVDTRNLDSLELGVGMKAKRSIARDSGAIIEPEVHAGYYYDLMGENLQKTSAFTGGGASFSTESPDPARHRINIGTGVTYRGTGKWDYSLTYNLDAEEDFSAHSVMAKASFRF